MQIFYSIGDLPISKLVHDDKYAYKKEGHGGKPVWEWPICLFFQLYLYGEKEKAEGLFIDWYIEQYDKYANVGKLKGGMKNGSLYTLYNKMQSESNDKIQFEEAVIKRVQQRFQLLEKIRIEGYIPNRSDPISALNKKNESFILLGGHHRIASLYVLQYKIVPGIYVYNKKYMHSIHNILKRFNR